MKLTLCFLLLTLSVPLFGQDTTSQDLSKELQQQMEHSTASSPFKGDGLSGTGRACSGYLRITPEFIHWDTGIYICRKVRYQVLASEKKGEAFHRVYKLLHRPAKCLFGVLELEHNADDPIWTLTAYKTVADRKKGYSPGTSVSCSLY